MFTAVAQKNLADAESYFDEHLAQNDYYAVGEIRPGQWIGAGAERLGLKNAVTRDQFHALCENRNPNDDERLTQRQQKENQRRVFFDFTCAPPKSVSVLAVTLDDQRLVEAQKRRNGMRGNIVPATGCKKPALVFHYTLQQIESSQRRRACRMFPKCSHVCIVARESFTDGLVGGTIMLRVQDRRFFPKCPLHLQCHYLNLKIIKV